MDLPRDSAETAEFEVLWPTSGMLRGKLVERALKKIATGVEGHRTSARGSDLKLDLRPVADELQKHEAEARNGRALPRGMF